MSLPASDPVVVLMHMPTFTVAEFTFGVAVPAAAIGPRTPVATRWLVLPPPEKAVIGPAFAMSW